MKETDVIITADQARVVLEHAGIFISGNRRSDNKKSLRHVKLLNLVVRCIIQRIASIDHCTRLKFSFKRQWPKV